MAVSLSPPLSTAGESGRAALQSLIAWARDATGLDGRFGLSFRADRRGDLYVAPWRGQERFFHTSTGVAAIDTADAALKHFVSRHVKGRLAYGYPVQLGEDRTVTPLLFCEVALRVTSHGGVEAIKLPDRRPRLHRRPLVQAGFDSDTVDAIVDRIEHGRFPSFAACLKDIADILGLDPLPFDPAGLVELPIDGRPGWYNAAVLFASPSPPEQDCLLGQLDQLATISVAAAEAPTLLSLVSGATVAPRTGSATTPVEVFAMTEDAARVLESGLSEPLTVVEAPPGCGKLALLGNLITSLAADGRSVLYVNPNRVAIDQLWEPLQAVLDQGAAAILRPGQEHWRRRLLELAAWLGQIAEARPRPPAGDTVSSRSLAERRQAVAGVRRQIEPLRRAHRHLASRQRWRLSLEREIAPAWALLFDPRHRLDAELDQIEAWRSAAHRLAGGARGRLGRWLRRALRGDSARVSLGRALMQALTTLPAEPKRRLMATARGGMDGPEGEAFLAQAFDQLVRFCLWQKALTNEDQALEAVLGGATAGHLTRQLHRAEAEASEAGRAWLRERWGQMLLEAGLQVQGRIRAAAEAIGRRLSDPLRPEPMEEQALAQAVSTLLPTLPLWMMTAEFAAVALPLTVALFDTVIVDDADSLSAASLMPLLLRGRRAVILGSLAMEGEPRVNGFGLAATVTPCLRLGEHSRSHPEIAGFLSDVFHGGLWRIRTDMTRLRDGLPEDCLGLQWHELPAGAPPAATVTMVGGLISAWRQAGLGCPGTAGTIGVVAARPGLLSALAAEVARAVPIAQPGERIAIGPPERFQAQCVDLLILVPEISANQSPDRRQLLAANRALYHDAAAAARCGLHVVGEADACHAAGGFAAALLEHCRRAGAARTPADPETGGPLVPLAALLAEAGLVYRPIDGGFQVFTRLGGAYRVLMAESKAAVAGSDDESWPSVLVGEDEMMRQSERLLRRLERLV